MIVPLSAGRIIFVEGNDLMVGEKLFSGLSFIILTKIEHGLQIQISVKSRSKQGHMISDII